MSHSFFNFELDQPVNQWLGIALISLMCFWTVLYYFVHNADGVAERLIILDGETIRTAAQHIRERNQQTPSPSILPE